MKNDIPSPVISVTHIIICIINRRVIARDRSKNGGKELARLRIARSLRAEGVTRASRGPTADGDLIFFLL